MEKSEGVVKEEEDIFDIDIDISMGEDSKEIPKANEKSDETFKDKSGNEQTVEIKQELIDETSRNPKRKHSSASQGDESSEKLSKNWSSGNYGEDVMFKEVFRPNKDKKVKNNKEVLEMDKVSIKQEPFEEDDPIFSQIDIKEEPNTTFSQVEEVIELDSDGEDPAYEIWCSSQMEMSSTSSKNIKQEPIEIDDSFSIASFDSPIHVSPKYDFHNSNTQPRKDDTGSDDDVIFLESDNKDLDLEGSQMALFEKIRKSIKIKKEKVDSQGEDMSHIDVIDLASPPKHNEDEIGGLSPILKPNEDIQKSFENFDRLQKDKSKENQNDPFSAFYAPTDDLPDLHFVSEKKKDNVSKSIELLSNETNKEDIKNESTHPTTPLWPPPVSPLKKRPIQLIDPLPQPPKKYARRLSSTSEISEGDKKPKELNHRDNKNEEEFGKDKWRSSHKPSLTSLSNKDKEKRAEALKELELRKKEQKSLESGIDEKDASSSSAKPVLPKIKTSKPKLSKLMSSLEDDQAAPRQPIRKAHKPKTLPPSIGHQNKKISSSSSKSVINSTKVPSKSVKNSQSNILASHIRTTAETTVDQ